MVLNLNRLFSHVLITLEATVLSVRVMMMQAHSPYILAAQHLTPSYKPSTLTHRK